MPRRLATRRFPAAAVAFACAAIASLACAAGAAADALDPGSRYLALGDSVSFGYREQNTEPPPDYRRPETFKGFPEHLARAMNLRLANAACPGETTSSLIDPNAPSFGCENLPGADIGYRDAFPLHVAYSGSQLSYAVDYLRRHPATQLVTLMVGANDLFRCQTTTRDACLSQAERDATFARIKRNVRRILSAIRTRADYDGTIVLVHYYSGDYDNPVVTGIIRELNAALDAAARGYDVELADGFGEFRRASRQSSNDPCKAGLLTQLQSGGCGVHPSYSGHAVLALAVERAVTR